MNTTTNQLPATEDMVKAMNLPWRLQQRLIRVINQRSECSGVHVGYADATHTDQGYAECLTDRYVDRG